MTPPLLFPGPHLVFDVESIGLHGEAFAVGWVAFDRSPSYSEVESGIYWMYPQDCRGDAEDMAWVRENCAWIRSDTRGPTHAVPYEVRNAFWESVLNPWKLKNTTVWADVGWPVEARFLAACVDDDKSRTWRGPYPLHEIATMRLAAGLQADLTTPRLPDEVPQHHPTCDARRSARGLVEAFEALERFRKPVGIVEAYKVINRGVAEERK